MFHLQLLNMVVTYERKVDFRSGQSFNDIIFLYYERNILHFPSSCINDYFGDPRVNSYFRWSRVQTCWPLIESSPVLSRSRIGGVRLYFPKTFVRYPQFSSRCPKMFLFQIIKLNNIHCEVILSYILLYYDSIYLVLFLHKRLFWRS